MPPYPYHRLFLCPKNGFMCFRYNKAMVTCWPLVIATGPIWVPIFHRHGQLLVQRGSLGDLPFQLGNPRPTFLQLR